MGRELRGFMVKYPGFGAVSAAKAGLDWESCKSPLLGWQCCNFELFGAVLAVVEASPGCQISAPFKFSENCSI